MLEESTNEEMIQFEQQVSESQIFENELTSEEINFAIESLHQIMKTKNTSS